MNQRKSIKLISIIVLASLLNGCDSGQGLILGIMAIGAVSGLWNAVKSHDDNKDNTSTSTTSSSQPTDNSTTSPTPTNAEFVVHSTLRYPGGSDDLLTAGLGQTGLIGAAPVATDPANPTAAEIRRATIVNEYQAMQDLRSASGYGTLYGSAVPTKFVTPSPDGQVSGSEYLAYADDGSGRKNVTLMVQVPDNFDRANPCIIAAPSPGSRGVYGAIGIIGEWGLKNHCAIAYTDKGTGNGVHELFTNTVNRIDGTRGEANDVGKQANFSTQGTSKMDLAAYNSAFPYRIAQKHAHSQQNPEANWGNNVLDAIRFAFQILNSQDQVAQKTIAADTSTPVITTLTSANTIVIAAGIATGGAAALRAAEIDSQGVIDGVVVAAPTITPRNAAELQGVSIQQGSKTFFNAVYSKTLFDVMTYYNVYQPCASANTTMGMPGRCAALFQEGLLSSSILTDQVIEAQKRLNDYGILESTNVIAHNYEAAFVYASFANLYANAYGSFSVVENLCDYSYAGSAGDQSPSAKSLIDLADDFQSSNGIPPTSGTHLINNHGNKEKGIDFRSSVDAKGNLDGYLSGAVCLRQLATGTTGVTSASGKALTGVESDHYKRVQAGLQKVLSGGQLRGKPTIIVHGRDDALAHVNFTSRPYYALNQKITGGNSKLVYLEVKNANHFDSLNQQYNITSQVPSSYYFSQALDRLYDNLKNGVKLPKSQVIRTVPTASTDKRLPAIDSEETCLITLTGEVLTIPECN